MYPIKLFNKISNIVYKHLPEEQYTLGEDIADYQGVLVRSADLLSTEFPKSLLAIARAGAGVNNIPIDRCTEAGIAVFNTPGANANAVKELVICGMLLSGRQVIPAVEWLEEQSRNGVTGIDKLVEKEKSKFTGPELEGKTLGVVGLGAIGVMVANAAKHGLGCNVMGYDPYMSVHAAWNLTRSITHARSLTQIFTECDYISLHLPLNDSTKKLIGKRELSMMKPDAVLLNFSRAGLADEVEVLAALENGTLRSYVTDFPTDATLGKKGVIAIPHLGASTPESEENCAFMAAAQLRDYLENGNIQNAVNLPTCEMLRSSGSHRLAIINENVPNMVGQITSVLATYGYNIENMLNKGGAKTAYTLIDLSHLPSAECVTKLAAIPGVIRVRIL